MLGRARMFGARLWARMPPEYLAALKAFAFQSGVPLAEYVRGMVHDHILQGGAAFRERGAALRALVKRRKGLDHRLPCLATTRLGLRAATTRVASKGQVVIPEAIKKAHELQSWECQIRIRVSAVVRGIHGSCLYSFPLWRSL